VDFRRSVAALGGDHARQKLDRRRSRSCRLLCMRMPKRTFVTRTQRAEMPVKSGAPGRGDPRWSRPSGTGPSAASGIIRFPDLWFVKSGKRAIRWIFDGVRPPWGANWTSGVFDRRRSGGTCHTTGEGLFGFPCADARQGGDPQGGEAATREIVRPSRTPPIRMPHAWASRSDATAW